MRELEITFDVGPAADKAALRHELNVFFEGACKQLVKEQRLRFKIRGMGLLLLCSPRSYVLSRYLSKVALQIHLGCCYALIPYAFTSSLLIVFV